MSRAVIQQALAQPTDTGEHIAHSLAGFRGGFTSIHKRPPTEQEIWNHAIRSWRDLNPVAQPVQPAKCDQNLAMLVRRFILTARRHCEDESPVLSAANNAWKYLHAQDLLGSPLRESSAQPDHPEDSLDMVAQPDPLFAAPVAAKKWAALQDEGYKMQQISFARDGKTGTIDGWGKVLWEPVQPALDALVAAARKVMGEFGTSSDGLQDLYQALKKYEIPQPIAQPVQPEQDACDAINKAFAKITPLPWFVGAGGQGIGLGGNRWNRTGGFVNVGCEGVEKFGGSHFDNLRFLCLLANSWPTLAVLAQPEQEPVAWTVAGQVRDWGKDFSAYQTQHYVRPIYTSPPQRQPLTHEQYTALAHRIASKYSHRSDLTFTAYTFLPNTLEQFVRAIETARDIKEKNE